MPNLVGIGNSQVPTNAMLGGMAYQDTDNVILDTVEPGNIAAIKASYQTTSALNNTSAQDATAVYIYDTRKDSDGGAWRKRTRHCSWYNEPLNTAIRGNRREFPCVAVIVANQDGFVILDADQPDCPMWLRYDLRSYTPSSNWGSGPPALGRPNFISHTPQGIAALNGQIAISNGHASGTFNPGWMLNMISEKALEIARYGTGSNQTFWRSSNIASRSDPFPIVSFKGSTHGSGDNHHSGGKSGITGRPMGGGSYTGVIMTVAPHAIIDEDTGLPTPTQIWSNFDGISVMNGATNAWAGDQYNSDNTWKISKNLSSTGEVLVYVRNATSTNAVMVGYYSLYNEDNPEQDIDYWNNQRSEHYQLFNLSWSSTSTLGTVFQGDEECLFIKNPSGDFDDVLVIPTNTSWGVQLYLGAVDGINEAIYCQITSTYTTGYNIMKAYFNGFNDTIKSVTANSTSVTGTVVYNNDFSSNSTGWSFADNATHSGGNINLVNTVSSRATLNDTSELNLTENQKYYFEMVVDDNVENWSVDDDGAGAGLSGTTVYYENHHTYNGVVAFVFKATASDRIRLIRTEAGNSTEIEIGQITIREIKIPDRTLLSDSQGGGSWGAAVVGTLNYEPVAEGAELLCYSGWSSSNYAVRGYNAGLTHGTSEWTWSFWVYPSSTLSGSPLFGVGNLSSNDGFRVEVEWNGGWYLQAGYLGTSNSFASQNSLEAPLKDSQWNHCVIQHVGSNIKLFINGVEMGSFTDSSVNWTTRWSKPTLVIGGRAGNIGGSTDQWAHSDTKLALLKFGSSTTTGANLLSEEEILKIYNDEKCLFAKNAKCTIYGTNDQAKDIAYDEDTGLWHVGTSHGRSDFNRLVRINNTTTNTNLIAASGGLIVTE